MKAPLINRIAANPFKVSCSIATLSLWAVYLVGMHQTSGTIRFFFDFPIILLHILILALLVGVAFFFQIPILLVLSVFTKKINECDFSEGKQVSILKGKHRNKIVTVAEVSQGQGGPKHRVIIVDEKDIPKYEERFFEEYEVGPPQLLTQNQNQSLLGNA